MHPRIIYDDRRDFPWVIVYGYDHEWGAFRTRKGALRELEQLLHLLGNCHA